MNSQIKKLVKHYHEHDQHDQTAIQRLRDSGENLVNIIEKCAEFAQDSRISQRQRNVLEKKMAELGDWLTHYGYASTDFDTIFEKQQQIRQVRNSDESAAWLKLTSGIIKEYVECEAWLSRKRTLDLVNKISTINDPDLFEPVKRSWEK